MNIKELAKKYGLVEGDFWNHKQSGQWILTHDAVEKVAAIEKIKLINRVVDNSEQDLVRYWITMGIPFRTINDEDKNVILYKEVSSIGEADRKNCHSQYLGCMAEKRGVDRCVLKLINAYEYGISSEVEAEDFKKPETDYTITDEQKTMYQELLNSGAYNGDKNKINKWWAGFTSFEQAEKGIQAMVKFVGAYEIKKQETQKEIN